MRGAIGSVVLGLVLLLAAGIFDAEPLYVCGTALLLLGAGAAGWVGLGGRGASIARTVEGRTVSEEAPLPVRLAIQAGRLPLPPGYVEEPLLGEPVRVRPGRRHVRLRVDATFARRGRRTLAPPTLVLRDPLGLAQHVVRGTETDEVLVLPRTAAVRIAAGGGEARADHGRAMLTAAAETEMDGLKPHEEGAPANRIHWPTVARGGGLMEKKLVAESDSRPLVLLDPRTPARPEDLDAAVRAAASLVLHFARRRGCGLLLPGDRRVVNVDPDLGAWPAAHARLALVEDTVGPALGGAQNRRGLVVFVSARIVERVPPVLGRTPGGSLLVVPGDLGRPAVLEVAGCKGYVGTRAGGGAALAAVAAGAPA